MFPSLVCLFLCFVCLHLLGLFVLHVCLFCVLLALFVACVCLLCALLFCFRACLFRLLVYFVVSFAKFEFRGSTP